MKRAVIGILLILLLAITGACAKKGDEKGPWLAKVGNTKITEGDLEREYKTLPEFAQGLFEGPEGKAKFLDELVKKELLYQEALKKGLGNDPDFQRKLEEFKKLTLIGQLLEKEIEAKANVTDEEVKEYYEKHKDELAAVSRIKASHILVKSEEEAQDIHQRLANGEDFAALAKKFSIDPGSAQNGGDLGYFSPGQMVPEFESAASKLKTGEISEPIKTKYGYHIIKVTDKKMGKPVEFEKVKSVLFQRIAAEKQKKVFDTYMENLKKNYKVQINTEAMSKLSPAPSKEEETGEPADQKKEEGKKD